MVVLSDSREHKLRQDSGHPSVLLSDSISLQPPIVSEMKGFSEDPHLTSKTEESLHQKKRKADKKAEDTTVVPEEKKRNYNDEGDGNVLRFKKLSKKAQMPMRKSKFAAGFDLHSAEDKYIEPQSHTVVKTDIAIALPQGTYGRVAPRSGLAVEHFIDVGAGVIDIDYRGNVGVVLFNHHKEKEFHVTEGMRIAQLVIEKIVLPQLIEVEELDDTERGSRGYGSTGK